MRGLLGDGYDAYIEALSRKPVRAFRVNSAKIDPSDFERINSISHERLPFVENAFLFDRERIGDHPFHHAGMIYVQEPAAMLPAGSVDALPDWKILDMCAAPGGKTGQLGVKLGSGGVLVSNEIVPSRCRTLVGNVERLGMKNTVVTRADSAKLAESYPGVFDLVVVDAPCSGEGMFRKEPKAIEDWSAENVKGCAARQRSILENAAECVRGGGQILYSTCTFSVEENEMVIDSFLRGHPDFELVPVKENVRRATVDGISFPGCQSERLSLCRRFYPHSGTGEGQFAALLKRAEGSTAEPRLGKSFLKRTADKTVFGFLDETLEDYDRSAVLMKGDVPVLFSSDLPVFEGMTVTAGVTIGEIRGRFIRPHHQLFSAMGKDFCRKLDLEPDGEEIERYLRGETLAADGESGFAAVTVCGVPLGGGKISGGVLKNYYPKGLRKKS